MSNWLFHVQSGNPPRTLKLFIYNEGKPSYLFFPTHLYMKPRYSIRGKLVLHLEKNKSKHEKIYITKY